MKNKNKLAIFLALLTVIPLRVNAFTFNRSEDTEAKEIVKKIIDKNILSENEVKHGTVYTFTNGIDIFGINSGIILDTSGINNDNTYFDEDLKKIVDNSTNTLMESFNKLSDEDKEKSGLITNCQTSCNNKCLLSEEEFCFETCQTECEENKEENFTKRLTAEYNEEKGGDTSSLEFEMTASGTLLNFNYIFLSEEFNQSPSYNDAFGLFVSVNNGEYENIAVVEKEDETYVPMNISTLRAGISGSEMYNGLSYKLNVEDPHSLFTAYTSKIIYNTCKDDGTCPEDNNGTISFNGMSNIFNAQKEVKVGDKVKVKLVIADASDRDMDSYVLIQANSLSFEPKYKANYDENELGNIKLVVSTLDNAIPLTKEEKILVEDGELVNVRLVVKDASETISEEDKNLINEKLENNVVAFYFDASLFKKVGELEESKITTLNRKIKITYEVEDKYKNTDETKNRTYKILRVHEDVAELIDGVYDPDTNILTFETDKFSSYALVYEDVDKIIEEVNPNTADNINCYTSFTALSMLFLGATCIYLKKENN